MSYVAAIDVGGTTLKAALYTRSGEELHHERRPTPRGAEAVVRQVLVLCEHLVNHGRSRLGAGPAAIGLACLGWVDQTTGVARASGAVGWREVPLRDLVAAHTGVPAVLDNDLRAGALAEARLGAGKHYGTFLFLPVGTGIGAALVLDGKPFPGPRGLAGELGHIVVEPGGQPCACGAGGCLEAEASATGIVRRYQAMTGRQATARQIAGLAAHGDPEASQVWQITVARLARGIATAAAMLDPQAVVIGGGVSLAGDTLLEPLRQAVARDFRLASPPAVVPAALGDTSARLGAALLAWQLIDGFPPPRGAAHLDGSTG